MILIAIAKGIINTEMIDLITFILFPFQVCCVSGATILINKSIQLLEEMKTFLKFFC